MFVTDNKFFGIIKRKRGLLHRLRFQRYWGKPIYLKRVESPRHGVSINYIILDRFLSIPQLSEKQERELTLHIYNVLNFYVISNTV